MRFTNTIQDEESKLLLTFLAYLNLRKFIISKSLVFFLFQWNVKNSKIKNKTDEKNWCTKMFLKSNGKER